MARLGHGSARKGYTLVEMLVATTLTLLMMGTVATVFGMIGEGISAARAALEMSDALRGAAARLRDDLGGILSTVGTVEPPTWPPAGPGACKDGYFEYVEGPMGPVVTPGYVARDTDVPRTGDALDPIVFQQDSTAGDTDDVLMFTTRLSGDNRFVGRYYNPTLGTNTIIESTDAEVAWLVRGRTLYRRQLLVVAAGTAITTAPAGFYANNDISVHQNASATLELNSIADDSVLINGLARPENRFAHLSAAVAAGNFPYHPHRVIGWAATGTPTNALARLNLPLLQECSDATWAAGGILPAIGGGSPLSVALNYNVRNASNTTAPLPFDAWFNPHPWEPTSGTAAVVDKETGVLRITDSGHARFGEPLGLGSRYSEDVILNNVIAFDVKAWDSTAPVMYMTRTRSGVTEGFVVLPGDVPHPAETGNPNAELYTGYAQAVARVGTTPTDSTATPTIAYTYTVVGTGAYVHLGYGASAPISNPGLSVFSGNGALASFGLVRVYDTWTNHYESNGINDDGSTPAWRSTIDTGNNSLDDDGANGVDDPDEREAPPPYNVPLRGIQIKLRVFEPDSRQIREVTIVQQFLP